MTNTTPTGIEFTGNWIGESMGEGANSPAHLWEIRVSNNTLIMHTHWEGDPHTGYFSGEMGRDKKGRTCFTLHGTYTFVGVLVSPQHFIIRGWDTNDIRGKQGAHFDVIFSRPGLAELTAAEMYAQHKASVPAAKKRPHLKTNVGGKVGTATAKALQTLAKSSKPSKTKRSSQVAKRP